MTNGIEIWLGALLLGAALFDVLTQDSQTLIALGRRLLDLIAFMRFWA